MREEGIEPSQALSHRILSPARLTAPALPPMNLIKKQLINFIEILGLEDAGARI